ncbi:ATP-grasp domain-containing protein [Acidiphilium sp. PA]|uniref:ATP-grasp domain-containing protein n=1 Tax=Acidiphilium sp. PA TaxID=2871705 RepID=UPI0022439EDB|nr:ATP-grasp domain-containing protein [Acidiphilium sp. PA]MCW8308613.1 ATP-grasp domain-containing protein [Acidiphilium sp. PA]
MSDVSFRTAEPLAEGAAPAPLAALPRPAAAMPRKLRGLLVCGLFTLPYRAMRCAAAAGVSVSVLGNAGSNGLRRSRLCARYTETTRAFDGTFDDGMIATVNAAIARDDIDFVFAGDQPSTRSLIAMTPHLAAPCFPMPDLATFDLLNDKARFTELCQTLGILCPPTQVFADRDALLASLARGETPVPAVIKPLSLDGNRGVTVVESEAEALAATIDYRPVLVQRFIAGADIGASVYAERGRVRGYICHRLRRATYTALELPAVFDALSRIVAATSATGILNFDMRLDPAGRVYFLECNPRVFYKMPLSMLLGVNFIALGLACMAGGQSNAGMPTRGSAVRSMKAILAVLPTPWRITRRDIAMLGYILADPVPYIRENLRIDWEDRSY